jgi:hypothetical protein
VRGRDGGGEAEEFRGGAGAPDAGGFAGAVDGAVGGAGDEFGAAVADEVEDEERVLVGAFAEIGAEVDGPEFAAAERAGFEEWRVGEAGFGVVEAAAGVVDDEIEGTVAVEVAGGGVVRRVALGRVDGDAEEWFFEGPDGRRGRGDWEDGLDGVGGVCGRGGVGEGRGAGERGGSESCGWSVRGGAPDVEGGGWRFGAERAP